MADVAATEVAATRTVAILLNWLFVFSELGIFQIDRPGGSECSSVTRESRWQNTIEHVQAARDQLQQLRRSSQSHGVTRFVRRQCRFARFDRAKHFFLRFANADPADCVSIEIKIDNCLRALPTQLFKRRALDSTDNKLPRVRWFCSGSGFLRLSNKS